MSRVLDGALTMPPIDAQRERTNNSRLQPLRDSFRRVMPKAFRAHGRARRKLGSGSAAMLSTTDGLIQGNGALLPSLHGQDFSALQRPAPPVGTLAEFKAKAARVPAAEQERFYKKEIKQARVLVVTMDERLKVRSLPLPRFRSCCISHARTSICRCCKRK